jgi:acyl carrier protein
MTNTSKIRQQCKNLLKDLLPVSDVNLKNNSDIFKLGIDSIRTMTLLARLQEIFNIKFNADEINVGYFRTINDITNLVQNKLAAKVKTSKNTISHYPAIELLKSNGSKTPFLCVPPLARSPHLLSNIIAHFDKDRQFWGFRYQGLHGEAPIHTSIENIAKHNISAIKKQDIKGPFLLGGVCFGSLIAFEMACQLESQNEIVEQVVVFDELLPPGSPDFRPTRSHNTLRNLYPNLDKLEETHLQARFKYRPNIYHGNLTFFHTTEQNTSNQIRTSWSPLVSGEIDIQEVPGLHGGDGMTGVSFINEPHVQILTQKLIACLDNADKKTNKNNST